MRVFGPVAHMKEAREQLGEPAALNEALVATGIDALFVLLDGGTVEIEGRKVALYRPDECATTKASGRRGGGRRSESRFYLVPVEGERE